MKLTWVKTGGHETGSIKYTANAGGFMILRTRIGGEWDLYVLYRNDRFLRGFRKVADAKTAAEQYGEPLIDIL